MKGLEKTRLCLENKRDLYTFLNSTAESFYRGAFIFQKNVDFSNKLKADILYFLIEVERVIKATFHSSLKLENVELEKFKEMFPNLSNQIFNINTYDDLANLGTIINTFRNINAHSIPSIGDYKIFKNDYSGLKKQTVFNPYIKYLSDDNSLTVAGLIFIICNLGRDNSLKFLTRKNNIVGVITNGYPKEDDGTLFVSQISHVNWEIKIRDDNCKTISDSYFGRMLSKAKEEENGYYSLGVEDDDNFDLFLRVMIDNQKIVVCEKSLTSVYYPKQYTLEINDKNLFIELNNQFPPFVFVDLLYKLGVTSFDKKTYEMITEPKKWELYSKLMYPKFYENKNIDILLAGKELADLKINSNICNGALIAIFMRLEKLIIKYYSNIKLENLEISRLVLLLKLIDAPSELIESVRAFRNLSFHGHILGEYTYINDEFKQYTIENCTTLMMGLLNFFRKSEQNIVYTSLCKDISNLFIGQLISVKTKLYARESLKLIADYPNVQNYEDLKVKIRFFDHSSLPHSVFNELNEIVNRGEPRYIEITVDTLDEKLILISNDASESILESFIAKLNASVEEDYNDGVVRRVILKHH